MLQLLSPTASSHVSLNDLQQSGATLIYEIGQQFAGSSAIQAEEVAKASSYLDQYPFPTFVNALFGRLADLYVADHTNDFVRLQILKAFEQSNRHLNKLSGVNLLFDKIFQVTYNTDDIARAITLRLLGTMSAVIPEVKADIVRHKVISSLDSKSEEELNAALFAATKFSTSSVSFSHQVFEKLIAKFISVNTDFGTREKLALCIVGLEYDNALFEKALKMVESSLEVVVDRHSSILLLKSLCDIATVNFVYVPETVNVLSRALSNFNVIKEQLVILQLLIKLTKFAHLWKEDVISSVSTFAAKSSVGALRAGCFHLFLNILECQIGSLTLPPQLRELALSSLRNGSFISIYGSLLMIYSGVSTSEIICSPTSRIDLMLNFQYCFSKIVHFRCFSTHPFLVSKLLKAVKLASDRNLLNHAEFIENVLPSIFDMCVKTGQFSMASAVLSALVPQIPTNASFDVTNIASIFTPDSLANTPSGFTTLALKFLLCCFSHSSEAETQLASLILKSADCHQVSPWQLYQIATYAIQCERLSFSVDILDYLRQKYSESLSLRYSQFLQLLEAITRCHLELWLLKFSFQDVSSCGNCLLSLQSKFSDIDFKCRSLDAHEMSHQHHGSHQLVTHFRSTWIRITICLLTVASNFISKLCRLNMIMSRGTESNKYLRMMFTDSANSIGNVVNDLSNLRSILIDGDDYTLKLLDELSHSLAAVQHVLFASGTSSSDLPNDHISAVVEQLEALSSRKDLVNSLKAVAGAMNDVASPTGIEALLEGFGCTMINLCRLFTKVPPMFFSSSQHTIVKLSLSPQPQVNGEPLILLQDTAFILKVEGVIDQVSNRPKIPLRHLIKKVRIVAKFTPKTGEHGKRQLTKLETIEPVVNDFFAAEFSFQPEINDIFLIRVSVEAIDDHGMRWLVFSGMPSSGIHDQAPQILLKSVAQLIRTPSQTNTGGVRTGAKVTV